MTKTIDGRLVRLEKYLDDRLDALCRRAVTGFAGSLSEAQLAELGALGPDETPPAWARAWLEEFIAADAERYAAACAFDRLLTARGRLPGAAA